MGFLRQGYCSGFSFPSPGDFPDPGIEPKTCASPAWAGEFFNTEPPGSPNHVVQFAYLKYTVQWLFLYPLSCATIITINFRTFLHTPTPHIHWLSYSFLPSPSPWQPLTSSLSWWILDISFMGHTACGPWNWLLSLPKLVFKVHPCYSAYWKFILFYDHTFFHWVDRPLLNWRLFGLFSIWGCYE